MTMQKRKTPKPPRETVEYIRVKRSTWNEKIAELDARAGEIERLRTVIQGLKAQITILRSRIYEPTVN